MKPRAAPATTDRKGPRTRARIVREAAVLFNMRGFAGTSVSDVSEATGLEKGGIYNHFGTKDDLAIAAFEYAAGIVREHLTVAMAPGSSASAQLAALLDVYRTLAERPFIAGGCPLLNTAVDADDTHPALAARARAAMDGWLALVRGTLERGVAAGEFRAALPVDAVSSTIVATLEGGVLLAKLYRDATRMHAVVTQLAAYIDGLRAPDAKGGAAC